MSFATRVCQFTFPVFALMATKYPSRLPKKSELSRIASPLFTLPTSERQIDGNGSFVFPNHFTRLCIQGYDGRRRFGDENSVVDYKGG